jgi:hypothetical protein
VWTNKLIVEVGRDGIDIEEERETWRALGNALEMVGRGSEGKAGLWKHWDRRQS